MHRKAAGSIYFIRAVGLDLIKIGYTGRPIAIRLQALRCASPARLECVGLMRGTLVDEKALHFRFAKARSHGEWFRAEPEVLAYIAEKTSPDHSCRVSSRDRDAYLKDIRKLSDCEVDPDAVHLKKSRQAASYLRCHGKPGPEYYEGMSPEWVRAYKSAIERLEMTHWPLGIPYDHPTPQQLTEIERAVRLASP